ncbi:MAG: hypothetical protein PHI41_02215 [Erysipelotrichaceae bacterium]|nr:hypothetical protein [Erysipelotrichaceae bacterium]MDD3809092.1 hypothetical protein [Erysipelotrichaceae bacterium]
MRKILFSFLVAIIFLAGCQSDELSNNTVKNGIEYQVSDDISFYYPDTFELSAATGEEVSFGKEDQKIYYKSIKEDTQNQLDDLDELYIGTLEQEGAQIIDVSKPIIASGLDCYFIKGIYGDVAIRFSELVYFTSSMTYVYGYQAATDKYNENSDIIRTYLETLVIDTGEK